MSIKVQGVSASGSPKEVQFEIKVLKADGSIETYGTMAYWHRNPLKRWWWALTHRSSGPAVPISITPPPGAGS